MDGNKTCSIHAIRIAIEIIMLVLFLAGGAEAVPFEEWSKIFGGTGNNIVNSVQQTSDGGYIIAGKTSSYGAGDYDVWLIKTDANGTEKWNMNEGKTFGGTGFDVAYSAQQTSDGGYVIAGETSSYGTSGSSDAWIIKTDAEGNQQWNKTFGGSADDEAHAIKQTSDGGYIIGIYTTSYGSGNADVWLIKTDTDGNQQWNKTFGGINGESISSVEQTSDGGYVIAGETGSYGSGNADVWLIKTYANGSEQWNRTFGGIYNDVAKSVQQTSDGGYIIAGSTDLYGSSIPDAWLIKTDINGSQQWNRSFGGERHDEFRSVQQTSDGGYMLAGYTFSYRVDFVPVAWLIKTNGSGGEHWNKTFFDSYGGGYAFSGQQTFEGGYIMAGITYPGGSGSPAGWLIKVSSEGSIYNINKGITYSTIQAAVDDANIGDEIHAGSGTYYENVNVNKQLILKSDETSGNKPVVDAGRNGSAFMLSANGIILEGFTATGGSVFGAGIEVNSNNNTLIGNNASNNVEGIILNSSNNNTFIGNDASNNGNSGIYIYDSNNNTFIGNDASNNGNSGIYMYASSDCIMFNNIFNNNNNLLLLNFESHFNTWNFTKQSNLNIVGGPYIGGNFWAYPNGTGFSQTCTDANKDGICDSPYTLYANNSDFLPLSTYSVPPGFGYIGGTVLNNSSGISNAFVTTNTGNSTTSGVSGFYSILVPLGTYNMTVTKEPEYYSNSTVVVTAILGTTVLQDIELLKKPTGNISGSVSAN